MAGVYGSGLSLAAEEDWKRQQIERAKLSQEWKTIRGEIQALIAEAHVLLERTVEPHEIYRLQGRIAGFRAIIRAFSVDMT